jgi:hypothetical protein
MKKKIAFALIMGIITTGIISFVLLSVNTDFNGNQFLSVWLRSWGIAYLVVIPCILCIAPLIERLINKLIS